MITETEKQYIRDHPQKKSAELATLLNLNIKQVVFFRWKHLRQQPESKEVFNVNELTCWVIGNETR